MYAKAATDERGRRVRQRRVVPTPRCWRQCTWRQQLSGRHGGKRAVLRGEYVISRKAIAQGMSDVLRCPVCSCAHSFYPLHMRPRVQRASGIPCALFSIEGEEFPADLGRNASRDRETVSAVIASEATCPPKPWRRRKQSIARRNERMDCFVAYAPRNDRSMAV